MRRIFTLILIALSLLALWSCDIFGTEHTHEFGEWTVIKEATCTEDGCRTRSCSCGETDKETLLKTGHTEEILAAYPATCTENGFTEGKKCTVCCETTVEQEEILVLKHDYKYTEVIDENNNIVTLVVCQRENCGHTSTSTAGLYDKDNNLIASWEDLVNIYMLSIENGTMSNLLEFYSNCEKSEIILKVNKLILDDSITNIDLANLMPFENLASIIISSSVTSITQTWWENCNHFINIIVDENNNCYKSIDGNLYSKDGSTLIQYAGGKTESEFVIPYGVKTIKSGAFLCDSSLEKLYIPDSVLSIESHAFYLCDSLTNICFAGTTEQWEMIEEKQSTYSWLSSKVLIYYDGKTKFYSDLFLLTAGSLFRRLEYIVDGSAIYENGILYNNIYYTDTLENTNMDSVLSTFDTYWEGHEKLTVLEKIVYNDSWYVVEKTNEVVTICQIDDIYYFLTFIKGQENNLILYTIHYSELHSEDWA